jgi:hypothetical protein
MEGGGSLRAWASDLKLFLVGICIASNAGVVGSHMAAGANRGRSMRIGAQGRVRFVVHGGVDCHGAVGPCEQVGARTPHEIRCFRESEERIASGMTGSMALGSRVFTEDRCFAEPLLGGGGPRRDGGGGQREEQWCWTNPRRKRETTPTRMRASV